MRTRSPLDARERLIEQSPPEALSRLVEERARVIAHRLADNDPPAPSACAKPTPKARC